MIEESDAGWIERRGWREELVEDDNSVELVEGEFLEVKRELDVKRVK